MTREEAIKLLVNATYSDEWQGNEDLTTAHNMAIEALEMVEEFEKAQIITGGRLNGRTYAYKCGLEDGKRKALKQQPGENCVSRKAVLAGINDWWGITLTAGEPTICDYIRELPSVTPQPKTGKWILTDDDFVYCSECEDSYYPRPIDASWYYCPNCGAEMEVEEE
jgi:hypothetical protein